MSKKLFVTTMALVFGFGASLSYAKSCYQDAYQMQQQISKYESVTTTDGKRITSIENVSGSEKCTGKGYYMGYSVCSLTWESHNWGNTLHCVA